MITGSYQRLLALGNLALFNEELAAGTLPEPRCSRCGNGVPVCADVGLPCSDACRGFQPDMPICWVCERDLERGEWPWPSDEPSTGDIRDRLAASRKRVLLSLTQEISHA